LIDQRHGGAKFDGVAGKFRHVDDFGALQLVFELGDAPFIERLSLLGGVVFRVLRKVAMAARLGDRLDDARALDLLQALEFLEKLGMASDGDRKLLHPQPCLDLLRSIYATSAYILRPSRLLARF